jgi:hypothetical protein
MKIMSTAFVKQLNIINWAGKIMIRMQNKPYKVQVKRTLGCDQRRGCGNKCGGVRKGHSGETVPLMIMKPNN